MPKDWFEELLDQEKANEAALAEETSPASPSPRKKRRKFFTKADHSVSDAVLSPSVDESVPVSVDQEKETPEPHDVPSSSVMDESEASVDSGDTRTSSASSSSEIVDEAEAIDDVEVDSVAPAMSSAVGEELAPSSAKERSRKLSVVYSAPEKEEKRAEVYDFPVMSVGGEADLEELYEELKNVTPAHEISTPTNSEEKSPFKGFSPSAVQASIAAGSVIAVAAILVVIGVVIAFLVSSHDKAPVVASSSQTSSSSPVTTRQSLYGTPICNMKGNDQKTLIDAVLTFEYAYYTLRDPALIPTVWPTAPMGSLASSIGTVPANVRWCATFNEVDGNTVRMELATSDRSEQNLPPYLNVVRGKKDGDKWVITAFIDPEKK